MHIVNSFSRMLRAMEQLFRKFGRTLQNGNDKYYLTSIYTMETVKPVIREQSSPNPGRAGVPPVQSVVKDIKREQILAEYAKQTQLPYSVLEMIYDTCDKMDEKKIKQLKKGNYKLKKRFNRPTFEPNQEILGVEVQEPLSSGRAGAPQPEQELSRIEEVEA